MWCPQSFPIGTAAARLDELVNVRHFHGRNIVLQSFQQFTAGIRRFADMAQDDLGERIARVGLERRQQVVGFFVNRDVSMHTRTIHGRLLLVNGLP